MLSIQEQLEAEEAREIAEIRLNVARNWVGIRQAEVDKLHKRVEKLVHVVRHDSGYSTALKDARAQLKHAQALLDEAHDEQDRAVLALF